MECLISILEILKHVDESILLSINHCHTIQLDNVMWLFSDRWFWIPFYILLLYSLVRFFGLKKALSLLIVIAVVIAVTDQFCASFLRPLIGRIRPSNPDSPIFDALHLVYGYKGGKYGFPSCHAANTFALAMLISLFSRNRRVSIVMFTWALLVSYSRLYLGVHYPSDILAGALIGSSIGYVFGTIFQRPYKTAKIAIRHYIGKPAMGIVIIFLTTQSATGQNVIVNDSSVNMEQIQNLPDSTYSKPESFVMLDTIYQKKAYNPYKFKPLQLIIPATLIGVGVIGLESDWLKKQNNEIKEELQENIDKKITLDDFTQFAPTATMYALDLFHVKGLHTPLEQTVLLGTSAILMASSVNIIKATSSVQRPDGSAYNSFPSGHTATAFMGAELLRREYWHVSPWIGVAGYAVAAGTGFFRMYNNRHWFTDVIAGAGIGILSVEIAYWLYPFITKTFFKKLYENNVYITPTFQNKGLGLTTSITF